MGRSILPVSILVLGQLLSGGVPASADALVSEAPRQVCDGTLRAAPVWVERHVHLMGTVLRVRVAAETRPAGLAASERALSAMKRVDSLLNTWWSDSELSAVNRGRVGHASPVSSDLGSLLDEVWQWSLATGGAFRPEVGALVEAWGLRGGGRVPSSDRLDRARVASAPGSFTLTREADAVVAITRADSLAWIDAGGFGKGAALRAGVQSLRDSGIESAVLDFGGQIFVLGSDPESIGVAHPDHRDRSVGRLTIADASVATTGGSERWWTLGDRTVTHVLDPRSGRPLEPWGSVTVVADDPLVADLLSTALFVMGPERGREWAESRHDVAALFLEVRPDRVRSGGLGLHAAWNEAMEPFLDPGFPSVPAIDTATPTSSQRTFNHQGPFDHSCGVGDDSGRLGESKSGINE